MWIGEFTRWCKSKKIEPSELVFGEDDVYIPGRTNKDQGFQFPKLRLGNLEAFRDWGYAGDYVEAMWMMLQQERPDDYVVCTGETHTIRQFLDAAFGYVGVEDWSELVVVDPKFYRPAEVNYLRGDHSKIKKIVGWEPKYGLPELVKTMMEHDLDGTI
jgi:GDPmannose 4,6-dehydratase